MDGAQEPHTGAGMRTDLDVDPGSFTAESVCLKPATITLLLSELELSEYRSVMQILTKEFKVDTSSTVFRQNRDVIVKGSDSVHDGNNPHEGNATRL